MKRNRRKRMTEGRRRRTAAIRSRKSNKKY
jgi:hypothetical protein